MARRNLLIFSRDGMVPGKDIMGQVLDFLFEDSSFLSFSCYGGSVLKDLETVEELLHPSGVVVAMTRGDSEWIFEVFFGAFTIHGFKKRIDKTDGRPESLWSTARSYFQILKKGKNHFEKHLPIE